jgi:hypothetical protein
MVTDIICAACAEFSEPMSTALETPPANAVDAPSIPRIAAAIHVLLIATLIADSSIGIV